MSISGGPNIIRDSSLIAWLDAADQKSYLGSINLWKDLSNSGNDVNLFNTPVYSSTTAGSLNFNNNPYGVCVNNPLNKLSYTKIAWFNPLYASANIISGGSSNGGQHAFFMAGTNNTLYAGHNGSWYTVAYTPNTRTGNMLNQWWCGAVTFDTTNGWKLYLNGILVNTNSDTTTFIGNGDILIGCYFPGANLFNGYINIAQIYNRVLSSNEIYQNFNALKSRFLL